MFCVDFFINRVLLVYLVKLVSLVKLGKFIHFFSQRLCYRVKYFLVIVVVLVILVNPYVMIAMKGKSMNLKMFRVTLADLVKMDYQEKKVCVARCLSNRKQKH